MSINVCRGVHHHRPVACTQGVIQKRPAAATSAPPPPPPADEVAGDGEELLGGGGVEQDAEEEDLEVDEEIEESAEEDEPHPIVKRPAAATTEACGEPDEGKHHDGTKADDDEMEEIRKENETEIRSLLRELRLCPTPVSPPEQKLGPQVKHAWALCSVACHLGAQLPPPVAALMKLQSAWL